MCTYFDGFPGVNDVLSANETFRGVHSNRANGILPKMLRHFEHEPDIVALDYKREAERGWVGQKLIDVMLRNRSVWQKPSNDRPAYLQERT
jgi:hypothetical protein